MNTKTISTPDFMGRIAKIVEEVRVRTCIDEIDIEVLEDILQDELNEYCRELDGYYDAGPSDGYVDGYDWLR